MIVKIISVIGCGACFLYTAYVLLNLTYFLSSHNDRQNSADSSTEKDTVLSTLWSLILNVSLLGIFMLQHSLMATDYVRSLFCKLRIDYLDRSVYNFASAASLHLLLSQWEWTPSVVLWKIDTASNGSLWLAFTAFHVLAWSIIYSGCLMMDISELAGLKQVYYKISSRPSPMVMKSRDLLRYYAHMRHPSFTGFLIILWIHPFMTLDRLLLASVLTIYMAMMWTIDQQDYYYHSSFVRRKQREFM